MATEGPGPAPAPSLTAVPRFEAIPRAGDGLDAEAVRAAFDAFRRQHRGNETVAFLVAQRKEQGHDALRMRLEADILLDHDFRDRVIARLRFFQFVAEIFFDRVLHQIGFGGGLDLRFDAKPGLVARCVANVLHEASHQTPVATLDPRPLRCQDSIAHVLLRAVSLRRSEQRVDILGARLERSDEAQACRLRAAPAIELESVRLERADEGLRQLGEDLVRLDRVAEPAFERDYRDLAGDDERPVSPGHVASFPPSRMAFESRCSSRSSSRSLQKRR